MVELLERNVRGRYGVGGWGVLGSQRRSRWAYLGVLGGAVPSARRRQSGHDTPRAWAPVDRRGWASRGSVLAGAGPGRARFPPG